MSCRHRIFRVVLIHVHLKESRPRLAIRGKGEPEECRRVLLDIVKMFGYSSDTLRHPLDRSPNDGRPKRDPESHRHPCPSDAPLIVRSSQGRNSATICRHAADEGTTRPRNCMSSSRRGDTSVYTPSWRKITYPAWFASRNISSTSGSG